MNMKHHTWSLAGLLALAALTFSVAASAATLQQIKDSGSIRIATANEIPYGYMEGDTAVGLGPSVAKKVLAEMGIDKIAWTVVPFGSLIPSLKADRVDMVAASQAIQPQRCSQVDYSTPNTTYGEGIMVKKGNPKNIHGYDAFVKDSSMKLGIVSGANQLGFAQKMGLKSNQIVSLRANADAASAVATGRIDGYAGTQLTVAMLAKKSSRVEQALPFDDPVIDGEAQRSWGGFTFAKDNTELRDAFNAKLKAFQKTDDWKNILMKYGLDKGSIDKVSAKSTEELCSAS
ncbi:ectoine/hydroxyectoine ABC transporter substrate-binding protein EhuB [Salinisphaera aquimarina]|uniref:Ectoine/hydroxyectoine ABC transporter substrate-binding protein EhuB n=1 Tax=Salinisphaera aquimarina TaxID=2094031 RepID=A0ABV7EVH3_9GAMM